MVRYAGVRPQWDGTGDGAASGGDHGNHSHQWAVVALIVEPTAEP